MIQSNEYQQFKEQFQLPTNGFLAPVDYIDGTFGFSTLKKYPNGYASLFSFIIPKEQLENGGPIKALRIEVSYGKENKGGLTTFSTAQKIKGIFDPVDLISIDDYFYNIETHKFFRKNQSIETKSILKHIDAQHRKVTKPIVGFWLRIKLIFWRIVAITSKVFI